MGQYITMPETTPEVSEKEQASSQPKEASEDVSENEQARSQPKEASEDVSENAQASSQPKEAPEHVSENAQASGQPKEAPEHVSENAQASGQPKEAPVYTCSVCLETITTNFGLLSHCDHVFCFTCISAWCREYAVDRSRRGCPCCRFQSAMLVPSLTFPVTRHEKIKIFVDYLNEQEDIQESGLNVGNLVSNIFNDSPPQMHVHEPNFIDHLGVGLP